MSGYTKANLRTVERCPRLGIKINHIRAQLRKDAGYQGLAGRNTAGEAKDGDDFARIRNVRFAGHRRGSRHTVRLGHQGMVSISIGLTAGAEGC